MQSHQQSQLTDKVLMVRPLHFGRNTQTEDNHFQCASNILLDQEKISRSALEQFDGLVSKLRQAGIQVIVVEDTKKGQTPDSVFPNNWISFYHDKKYILYPMYAPNRRLQRKLDIFTHLPGYSLLKDYSKYEEDNIFLEGTGSLILDRITKTAYAALSNRTHQSLALTFCKQNGYSPCFFKAYHQGREGKEELIYHTNVMFWVGDGVCGVCLESIRDEEERKKVRESLEKGKRDIVELTQAQVASFAGNVIMLGTKDNKVIVMSQTAFEVLAEGQKATLSKHGKIIYSNLSQIQKNGGGSARCMIAQIF